MATPKDTVWKRDGHTGAKHDLLRRYLQAWVPILVRTNQRVTYAEGFAGPGIYKDGEPGSPVIALQAFCQQPDLLNLPSKHADLIFVEERADRVARLEEELRRASADLGPLPAGIEVHKPIKGDCAHVLADALAAAKAAGDPMFVVLDSFGGPDIPYALLQLVASNRSSEVLLTFAPSFLTRHGERDAHRNNGDLAFGGRHWHGVFTQPSDKKLDFLVHAYRTTLSLAGFRYTLAFEMRDEGGHELWLLFGTSNPLGVDKMKSAMWAVDPVYGIQYRDPNDPDQMFFDIKPDPDLAPLRRIVLEHLVEPGSTLDELRTFVDENTMYRRGQVLAVVRELVREGAISKPDGRLEGHSLLVDVSQPHVLRDQGEQGSLLDLLG